MDDEYNEKSWFYCIVPEKYSFLTFQVSYIPTKLYPCTFMNFISKKSYECENSEELKNRIEKEIRNELTKNTLGKLLYHFYGIETIKTIK